MEEPPFLRNFSVASGLFFLPGGSSSNQKRAPRCGRESLDCKRTLGTIARDRCFSRQRNSQSVARLCITPNSTFFVFPQGRRPIDLVQNLGNGQGTPLPRIRVFNEIRGSHDHSHGLVLVLHGLRRREGVSSRSYEQDVCAASGCVTNSAISSTEATQATSTKTTRIGSSRPTASAISPWQP